jgi:hypothetical protein
MAKRLLVIDNDQGSLFLHIEGGALAIGASPTQLVLRDLHVLSIRCEVEVEEDVFLGDVATESGPRADNPLSRRQLHPGQSHQVGGSLLRLESASGDDTPPPAEDEPPQPQQAEEPDQADEPAGALVKQLSVFDGADRGRTFRLPESGTVNIGNSPRHANFVLHDLYVSRVHCLLEIGDDRIFVKHSEGKNGTLINGRRITAEEELHPGDVLRVGNSHLRLETAVIDPSTPDPEAEEPASTVEKTADPDEGVALAPGQPVAAPAPAVPDESLRSLHPAVARLAQLEGQVLGQYRVGPLLGRGHSGLIFRAQHLKSNLVVGLKVLSSDFPATGEELQRFVQALKTASGVRHANLIDYYGAGRSGVYCWIAREWVEGESAARKIQALKEGGKLNWSRAALTAVHLGRALACVHQHRLVHGNITPRNVLIRTSDRVAKLSDLLLAQALEGSKLQEAILEKKLLDELPYLAPEQTETGAFVDQLADLYALGAVLYALLTGRPPFLGASPEETLTLIRTAKLVKPTSYQRGIPGPLETVVLKLLARHQEDRYQTAGQLLADLEPIVGEQEGS